MFWRLCTLVILLALDTGADLLLSENANVFRERRQQKPKEDDDKKTLSQQVIDGKYGLIQKELFKIVPKRPGIVSYDPNNEVPKDNAKTLGGLNKTDIWLAENHLLVLKGGLYPVEDNLPEFSKSVWPPIDNFLAPRRPVKIPENPKVPPPFPVQLEDGGPLQILGDNITGTFNGEEYTVEGNGHAPFPPPTYTNTANTTTGQSPFGVPPFPTPISGPGNPFPFPLNGSLPPFFDYLPPGAAILPPPNLTEPIDEDDLSIYYPPPYSFYYQQDNSTQVPPGPLVPGIILPPPPDFFAPLHPTTTQSVPQIPTTTPPTTTTNRMRMYLPPPKPTVKFVHANYTRIRPVQTRLEPRNFTTLKQVTNAHSSTQVPLNAKTAQFYFYEESPPTSTLAPPKAIYRVGVVNTTPYVYKKPTLTYKTVKVPQPADYYYVTNKPQQLQQPPRKADSFRAHIEQLQQQIQYQFYPQVVPPSPKPVYQYSFQVANYDQQHQKFASPPRYSVEIQPAVEITTHAPYVTTPAPPTFYYKKLPSREYYKPKVQYQVTPSSTVGYTKDDQYLDDITRTYFTTFGQKIASTTPTYVPRVTPKPIVNYAQQVRTNAHAYGKEASEQRVHVQTVEAIGVPIRPQYKQGPSSSFISYELPGDDGAHFYFLTPQLAEQRDQGVSYFYSKSFRGLDHQSR